MLRILPIVFTAASLGIFAGARAAETITLLPTDDAHAAHEKLVAAAERACRKAIEADLFGGEFGTVDECVTESVKSARPAAPAQMASAATR